MACLQQTTRCPQQQRQHRWRQRLPQRQQQERDTTITTIRWWISSSSISSRQCTIRLNNSSSSLSASLTCSLRSQSYTDCWVRQQAQQQRRSWRQQLRLWQQRQQHRAWVAAQAAGWEAVAATLLQQQAPLQQAVRVVLLPMVIGGRPCLMPHGRA